MSTRWLSPQTHTLLNITFLYHPQRSAYLDVSLWRTVLCSAAAASVPWGPDAAQAVRLLSSATAGVGWDSMVQFIEELLRENALLAARVDQLRASKLEDSAASSPTGLPSSHGSGARDEEGKWVGDQDDEDLSRGLSPSVPVPGALATLQVRECSSACLRIPLSLSL